MTTHVVIYGTFPSLNEFISALNSRNRSVGNNFKKRIEREILKQLEGQLMPLKPPVTFNYYFYEPNNRRDADNVASCFIKCWQDALVKGGYLGNDGRKYINKFTCEVNTDGVLPRVEIFIESED